MTIPFFPTNAATIRYLGKPVHDVALGADGTFDLGTVEIAPPSR